MELRLRKVSGATTFLPGAAASSTAGEAAAGASRAGERLRARALALLDLLTDRAEAEGELDEAVRLLERAIETDDESRYVALRPHLTPARASWDARGTGAS